MNFKKVFLTIVLAALSPALFAQTDDFCLWTAINMKTEVGENWTVGLRSEHRAQDNASETNQFYLRPVVGYDVLPWMNITAQADFAWMSSGFAIRLLPQITFSQKYAGFDFSLRQRLQTTYKPEQDSWSSLFRTKAQIKYRIGKTPFTPLVAVEPYYMSEFARTRYYFGTSISLSDSLSLLLQYVFQDQYQRSYDDHVLWLTLNVKLNSF